MRFRSGLRSAIRRYCFDPQSFKYHFIHIPKNGGVTVRRALELQRDVSLSNPYHYRYVDIADQVGRDRKYFSVVRNPWSRTASRYQFARQNAPNWPDSDPRRQYVLNATFADYVKDHKVLPNPKNPGEPWMGPLSSWFNQLEWLRDESGQIVCDCLRLECLEDDLSAYLRRRVKVTRRNATRQEYDYRAMYTTELAEFVSDLFREDIQYFGFDFDHPATRNISVLLRT